jgi:hypothetical protein
MEMNNSPQPTSTPPRNIAPAVMILLASVMLGAASGIVIADRNAFSVLKDAIPRELARLFSSQPASPRAEGVNPDVPVVQAVQPAIPQAEHVSKVIPIGLSSIDAIRYSPQSDSARIDFSLEALDLVGTGVLGNPDRVYLDLQEGRGERGMAGPLKARKVIRVDDDMVTGVRISQWESGAMRIVLDLGRSCDFTHQILPGSPSRLSVQLRPRTAGASSFQ